MTRISLKGVILGGYIAARIANHDHLLNGTLSSLLCVGLVVSTLMAGVESESWWLSVLLFVASPALGAFGGYLRLRVTRASKFMPAVG